MIQVVNRVSCLVDRLETAYLGMAIRVYRYAPIIKVSALVIFLYLILSGDIELNPGPKYGKHLDIHRLTVTSNTCVIL